MAQKTIFELDLVRIARWYKRGMVLVLFMILAFFSLIMISVNSTAMGDIVGAVSVVLYILMIVLGMIIVPMLQRACGASMFMTVLSTVLVLFLHVIILIVTLSTAGTILRLAGAKIGFLGISADEFDKLRQGHCRGCGYNREGLELLQMCPECQRVPQVI